MVDYNEIAQEYARHRRVHPDVLQDIIKHAVFDGDARVLELGCGTGNYISTLHVLLGCEAWGIDPSREMLAQAEVQHEVDGVNFVQGRAERLEFPHGYFDFVFSVDVIHHVGGRRRYFEEAYRVLKPGGRVCTVTDSEAIIRHREPLSTYFPETVPLELERYPRISELRSMMEGVGFVDVEERNVEFGHELPDLQMYRDKAYSMLHLIDEDAFQRGMRRLEADFTTGTVRRVARYVLVWGEKQA
jgi:ubiquinone/menaquinone biosynthesis C-methylase UbiE